MAKYTGISMLKYEYEFDNIGSTGGDGIQSKFNAHLVPVRNTECVIDRYSYTTKILYMP